MITRSAFTTFLNSLLKPELFKDYCLNGLQIEGKESIRRIGCAVSANLDTIQQAVDAKVDALICHHGLFWRSDSYLISGSKKEKIALLLQHQISLFGYHLPLDAHREIGNNWRVALDQGWEHLEPFGIVEGASIGVKGRFSKTPIEAFIAEMEAYYGHIATIAKGGKDEVSSVALISGGAWRSVWEAAEAKVDCFVTGNFDEPAWHGAHEEGIHFLALGHSATERVGPKALAERIQEKLSIESLFIESENPF